MLIVQSPTQPTRIRNALADLIALGVQELHVASAYVTWDGSRILLDQLRAAVGEPTFAAMRKRLVTSFDFGLTEPRALREWLRLPAAEVFVAGAVAVANGSLAPRRAFHPKLYLFPRMGDRSGLLVGSANLTVRGLSVNAEAAWLESEIESASALEDFRVATEGTEPLTEGLIVLYEQLRTRRVLPPQGDHETAPVDPPELVDTQALRTFRDAVETGAINPSGHESMWVQNEGMQGGAGNQQELPRLGNRFFNFAFSDYANEGQVTIGKPVLRSGPRVWDDRILKWHGHNRMERLNLPTQLQGGFEYLHSAVLFRRLRDGSFELVVAPWDSDMARAWRKASAEKGLLFRLGKTSNRLVGLI